MRISHRTIVYVLVVLAAAGVGTIHNRVTASKANMSEIVAHALSQDANVTYVAKIVTSARYNGRRIKKRGTVYHSGSAEKVEYAEDSGRQVWSMVKDGKAYTCLPKDNKILVSEISRALSDKERGELLNRNYDIKSRGTERIAGRNVYAVNIFSRNSKRLSKRLWIDKEYFTTLKSVDYSSNGEVRGSTQMEKIEYDAKIDPSKFAVPTGKSINMVTVCKTTDSAALFKELGMPARDPQYIPEGYELEGYHLFSPQCSCTHKSAQITYTDGLNVISVFQTPTTDSCEPGSCDMSGSESHEGCAVTNCDVAKTGKMTHPDRTVVVVGDISPNDVQKIAASIK